MCYPNMPIYFASRSVLVIYVVKKPPQNGFVLYSVLRVLYNDDNYEEN